MKRPSTLPPRLITPDSPDVPPEFAVIEGDDAFDACDQARDAFLDPSVRMVVWHDAAFLPPYKNDTEPSAAAKAAVSALTARVQGAFKVKNNLGPPRWSIFRPEDDFLELGLRDQFNEIGEITKASNAEVKDWRDATQFLAEVMEDSFETCKLKLRTHFQNVANNQGEVRTDIRLRSNTLRAFRVLEGDPVRFYSSDDVAKRLYHKGISSVLLKENAQPWVINNYDVAFISQNTVYEQPSRASGSDPAQRRVIEIYDMKAGQEFITNAERPFFRKLFRRPGLDYYDM